MTTATKPVTRKVHARPPHGVRPEIAVTIYPDGTIGLRECGRALRTEQRLEVGQLYAGAIEAACRKMVRRVKELRKDGRGLAEARRIARKEVGL
jgi:hypothetical protein